MMKFIDMMVKQRDCLEDNVRAFKGYDPISDGLNS